MPIVIPKNELNEFSLPRVCVTTGQAGPVTFQKVSFQYLPPWVAVFALAPLLYLIVFFIVRRTANGTLPFSDEGWERVKAARRNVVISTLVMILSIVLGIAAAVSSRDGEAFMLVGFGAAFVAFVALIVFSVRVRKVFPVAKLIDDRGLTLNLPSKEAEEAFQRHLSAGARAAA